MNISDNITILEYLQLDHSRLDRLLKDSLSGEGDVDVGPYEEFRNGILRHIGIEEKFLFPALRDLNDPDVNAMMDRLHLDHAALSVILILSPSPKNLERISAILRPHNVIEEESGGLYEKCDALPEKIRGEIIEKLLNYPNVKLKPYSDNPLTVKLAEQSYQAVLEADMDFFKKKAFSIEECEEHSSIKKGSK